MSQLLATGTRVVYDTTDDMTLDQAKQAARDELGGEVGNLASRVAAAELLITPAAIVGTVTSSSAYGSLSTTVTQTATGLSSVQTKQTEIDGRMQTIEESVIIDGSTITIGKSDVPVQNIINETGFEIKEVGGTVLAYAREGKMGAQRLLLEDALIIGGAALKDMQDGHVLLLKYGG